jgi:hypothetical protein
MIIPDLPCLNGFSCFILLIFFQFCDTQERRFKRQDLYLSN